MPFISVLQNTTNFYCTPKNGMLKCKRVVRHGNVWKGKMFMTESPYTSHPTSESENMIIHVCDKIHSGRQAVRQVFCLEVMKYLNLEFLLINSIKMEVRILDTTSWDHTSSLYTCWMYQKSSKLQHGKWIMAHSNISASAGGRSTGITVFSQEEIILKEMDLFNLYDFQFLQH